LLVVLLVLGRRRQDGQPAQARQRGKSQSQDSHVRPLRMQELSDESKRQCSLRPAEVGELLSAEAVELGRAVSALLADAPRFRQDLGVLDASAEVTAVQLLARDGLRQRLQLAQRELLGQGLV